MLRWFRPLIAVVAAVSFFGFMAPSCGTETFRDDFSGSTIDTAKWRPNWLGSSDSEITKPVNGLEDDCFVPGNAIEGFDVANLQLTSGNCPNTAAGESCPSCGGTVYPWRGSMIQTADDYTFTYGYVEARIWLPGPTGQVRDWPAFWVNGFNWPNDVEMDVMEGLSGSACWHIHYGTLSAPQAQGACVPGDWRGWHTYALDWRSDHIAFIYDGTTVATLTQHVPNTPHYLAFDYSVDDDPGGSASVQADHMLIDYVFVDQ
jgi:beta-glucanase (GH16 family)